MVEVKLLTSQDAHILTNVAEGVFDDPIVESSTREFLNDPRHRLVVALDNNIVVGFISAVIYLHPDKPAPEMWINEVGVAPSHQSRGIGKSLMRRVLDEAKRLGCKEAWVLTERENSVAMRLYESVGGREEKPDAVMFTFEF